MIQDNSIQTITTGVEQTDNSLYTLVHDILQTARRTAYKAVNFAMVTAYWQIGKVITEDELRNQRAQYGKAVLRNLAERLTQDFGKGFDERDLRKMCQFYRLFPIWDTLRPELSWSHYRKLLTVENEDARTWYMNEAAEQVWSTRQLDRQVSTLYYERLRLSTDKQSVADEAKEKLRTVAPENFIHDPVVLEFLNLKDYPALHESDLEQTLIDNLQGFLLELGKGFCFVARQKTDAV